MIEYISQKGGSRIYRAKVSKWGNSQGIWIPAEVMRQKNMCIGDEVQIDTSQPDAIVITVSKSEKSSLEPSECSAAMSTTAALKGTSL